LWLLTIEFSCHIIAKSRELNIVQFYNVHKNSELKINLKYNNYIYYKKNNQIKINFKNKLINYYINWIRNYFIN